MVKTRSESDRGAYRIARASALVKSRVPVAVDECGLGTRSILTIKRRHRLTVEFLMKYLNIFVFCLEIRTLQTILSDGRPHTLWRAPPRA